LKTILRRSLIFNIFINIFYNWYFLVYLTLYLINDLVYLILLLLKLGPHYILKLMPLFSVFFVKLLYLIVNFYFYLFFKFGVYLLINDFIKMLNHALKEILLNASITFIRLQVLIWWKIIMNYLTLFLAWFEYTAPHYIFIHHFSLICLWTHFWSSAL